MKQVYIKAYEKHKYSTDILKIRLCGFLFNWFIEYHEWFIYIYFGRRWLRFSSVGFLKGELSYEEYKDWLGKYYN